MTTIEIAAATAVLLAIASPVFADERAPTDAESSAISSALKTAGFNTWSNIELDDGKWEVDNAVHADGKVYDVELRLADLAIIKKDLED